jgi:arabinogalactan endo-1,4-beta-galactosidase
MQKITQRKVDTSNNFKAASHYELWHETISKSASSMSEAAKKLTAIAMSVLPPDLSSTYAMFNYADFCKAV